MSNVSIHPDLLFRILFGSPGGRRFTQDTPVLPEVWTQFAKHPGKPVDGLIVPRKPHQAHHVANELYLRIGEYRKMRQRRVRDERGVSDLPGLVTVRAHFDEVVNIIMPMTRWWRSDCMETLVWQPPEKLNGWAVDAMQWMLSEEKRKSGLLSYKTDSRGHLGNWFELVDRKGKRLRVPDSTARLIVVLGALNAAHQGFLTPDDGADAKDDENKDDTDETVRWVTRLQSITPEAVGKGLGEILHTGYLRRRNTAFSGHFQRQYQEDTARLRGERRRLAEDIRDKLIPADTAAKRLQTRSKFDPKLIFSFGLNRKGKTAVHDSVKTAKADAARRLFELSNNSITWAIIDSGIDSKHFAFRRYPADTEFCDNVDWDTVRNDVSRSDSRVTARYDMTLINDLRDRDKLMNFRKRRELADTIALSIDLPTGTGENPTGEDVMPLLNQAREDLKNDQPMDWNLAERIMRVRHGSTPSLNHGTHVAGTLGGRWPEQRKGKTVWVEGMCPDIRLMDFNVIGGSMEATEFATVAAMRLIRHLNERADYMVVHGANLSLGIPHDVTNYACGRTPVCEECETLVNNGVVVVAAAGNSGYNVFHTDEGKVPLHSATSIADPGNAEAVITVGSTHRREPHTYGVSYFSSRGPTGDGRMKPDLVAPGEKINAPICEGEFARLEGTSMAAPHVSGAAAMLMSRFPELIGNPKRIKQILCETATDLGRERAYQGCGLVDVLRALQSV